MLQLLTLLSNHKCNIQNKELYLKDALAELASIRTILASWPEHQQHSTVQLRRIISLRHTSN